jgi:hypothetical protein
MGRNAMNQMRKTRAIDGHRRRVGV